jgi:hypothetical protein
MREFTKVPPSVWQSKAFKALGDDSQRLLYLYLHTSGHQTSAGCCYMPSGYACADLEWSPQKYTKAISELKSASLVQLDDDTKEILILDWFTHNPPMNEKHRIGTGRLIAKIQSEPLRKCANEALGNVWALRARNAVEARVGPSSALTSSLARRVGNG